MTKPPERKRPGELKRLRLEKGLTQEALAAACGITKVYLSEIERGKRDPSTSIALRLASALGVRVEDLYGYSLPATERRRSSRIHLAVPLEVGWKSAGSYLSENAQTEIVNAHGALLRMHQRLTTGTQVELKHFQTGQLATARVVNSYAPDPDGLERIAIELSEPSYTFWGAIPRT